MDWWRQTHVTTFEGGGAHFIVFAPGAENPSYATV